MKIRGESFLNDKLLKLKVEDWQKSADYYEHEDERTDIKPKSISPYYYKADRIEGSEISKRGNIERLHHEQFVSETIPLLIKDNPGRKIKILDVGGGVGMFAQQIRDTFGSQVEVFTTGLRKKSAIKQREQIGITSKLHPNDLKWRSVLQLHNFPEFDLIIDTFGEVMYGVDDSKKFKSYLFAIVQKLLPGGHASTVGLPASNGLSDEYVRRLLKKVENTCKVKTEFITEGKRGVRNIKIYKPKDDIEQLENK